MLPIAAAPAIVQPRYFVLLSRFFGRRFNTFSLKPSSPIDVSGFLNILSICLSIESISVLLPVLQVLPKSFDTPIDIGLYCSKRDFQCISDLFVRHPLFLVQIENSLLADGKMPQGTIDINFPFFILSPVDGGRIPRNIQLLFR